MYRVAIIGRPNVGKSSFFNQFIKKRYAIVSEIEGTTRDCIEFLYEDTENRVCYILEDTGGLHFFEKEDELSKKVKNKTLEIFEKADVIIWILEYNQFTLEDEKILKYVCKRKNTIVVANKADNEERRMEAYSLPVAGMFDHFYVCSTTHNYGFIEIKKAIALLLKREGREKLHPVSSSTIRISFIGRPNVGKSSIINTILGEDRVIVHEEAGTTRDSISVPFTWENISFTLVDTAGIRRLSRIGVRNIENWSVLRAQRSIEESDVVCIVIDVLYGIHKHDLSLIRKVKEGKKGIILVFNKWDMVANMGKNEEQAQKEYEAYLSKYFDFITWYPKIFTSVVLKKNIFEILKHAYNIFLERGKRIQTSLLNSFLQEIVVKHRPTGNKKSHHPKIYYMVQVEVHPPKFLIYVNNSQYFHFSYLRYIENRMRERFGFFGTPIDIELRGKGD